MAKTEFTVHEVVKKLIGPINPAGAEHIDAKRFENLEAMIDLTESLLRDLYAVSLNSKRQEASMCKAGKKAASFLYEMSTTYE
jgi:hypothetical protein